MAVPNKSQFASLTKTKVYYIIGLQPPENVKPWKNVRPATRFGSACPQPKQSDLELCNFQYQNEDCLYLNIYSPYEVCAVNYHQIT